MNKFKESLLWMWLFPLNLCGIIYRRIIKNSIITTINKDNDYITYLTRYNGGVTLGKYVFVYLNYSNLEYVIKHESGHVILSKMLGPLYLLVIGLPSLLHAIVHSSTNICGPKYDRPKYEHFFTEKWANKLAGIN